MPTQNIPHPPGHVPTCVVAPVAVRAIFCSWRTLGQVIVAVIPIPTAQGKAPHMAFQYSKGSYKQEEERLFTRTDSNRTRGNGLKLRWEV